MFTEANISTKIINWGFYVHSNWVKPTQIDQENPGQYIDLPTTFYKKHIIARLANLALTPITLITNTCDTLIGIIPDA